MGFCQWAEVGPKVGLKWDTSGSKPAFMQGATREHGLS